MRPKPYVGIAGVTTAEDLQAVLRVVTAVRLDRLVVVGVLASSKTLAGKVTRYPQRYPGKRDIAGLCQSHSRVLNVIHYATDEPDTLECD